MKLAKLSLAAIVVAGLTTSSFAADTLADAFSKGKIKGELKAWYFDKEVDNTSSTDDADIFVTGVMLGYVTDKLNGFNLGATVQSSFAPFADDEAKSVFKSDMYGSGAVLSEAYLVYSIGKTTAKIGRQFIATPLVNGSGSRVIKESFEGATIVNTDIPATTLIAGYVDKFQGRTSTMMGAANGDAPKFENRAIFLGVSGTATKVFDDAYTIAVINKSIPNLTLTGQYAWVGNVDNKSDVDVYFAEGKYVLPMKGFKLGFDVNYRGSLADATLGKWDGTYTAGRISISELSGFGAAFTAATTSSDDAVIAGMGNGASTYTASLVRASSATLTANTDSYKIDLTYDFSKLGVNGLKGILQHAWTDQGSMGTASTADYTSYAAGLDYAVPSFKGLIFGLQYESQEKETSNASGVVTSAIDTNELRFRATYKF